MIVTAGTPASLAVKKATSVVPLVMIAGDPVDTGIVSSLARPGGNITGLSGTAPDLEGKRCSGQLLLHPLMAGIGTKRQMLRRRNFGSDWRHSGYF